MSSITSRTILICTISVFSIFNLSAEQWKRVGPNYKPTKGLTYDVLPDPRAPGVFIVGTRPQGLLKSVNSGKNWKRTSEAFPKNGNIGPNQESMSRSLSHPDILYAGIELTGIKKSIDNGKTWTSATSNLPKGRARNGVSTLIHPTDPNTVWLGTDGGLFKTTDGGLNWTRITKGLPTGKTQINNDIHQTIAKIIIDEKNPQNMWLGLYATGQNEKAGVWRSNDGGESWIHSSKGIETGIDSRDGYNINRDWVMSLDKGSSNNDFIMSTPFAIYISKDSAKTWKKLNFEGGASAVAINPQNPQNMFAAVNEGYVKESRDGGKSWTDISRGLITGKIENAPVYNVRFKDADGNVKLLKGTDHRFTNKIVSFHFTKNSTLLACAHSGLYELKLKQN